MPDMKIGSRGVESLFDDQGTVGIPGTRELSFQLRLRNDLCGSRANQRELFIDWRKHSAGTPCT